MRKTIMLLLLSLICALTAHAQQTTFTPNCGGDNDTSRFTALIAQIGANTGTIRLPYKGATRCAVNNLTIPANITLDNGIGSGISVNAGQTLVVLGPVVNPVGRAMFFGPGAISFTGNTHIGMAGQALLSDGAGGTVFGTGGGGSGLQDPGANGIVKRTAVNVTAPAVAGTDYLVPNGDGSGLTNLNANNISSGTLAVARGGTGTGTQFTPGSVVFAGGGGIYAQDNGQFFYDDSNNRLGLGTATPAEKLEVVGNVFVNSPTANLFLRDTGTGLQAASSSVITLLTGNCLRSISFTSGLSGLNLCANGNAEFDNITARGEFRASVFKVNEIAATAGTLGVFYSASTLTADATTPALSGSFSLTAKNSDAGGMLFGVGDVVRLKGLTGSGVISDSWATITARVNNGTTTTYTATLNSGSTTVTFTTGAAVIDYGPNGTGFLTLSTDGTVGASPNLTMATHNGAPWSAISTQMRCGNLNESYGFAANTFGCGFGLYGVAGQSWSIIDAVNGFRAGNNTTTNLSIDPAGNASFTGTITANQGGTIAGWTISSNRLSSGITHLASTFDIPGGAVAWFGQDTTGRRGVTLRESSGRELNIAANHLGIYPYLQVLDGTFTRVLVGGLNGPFNGGPSVDSMGMKIWDASGNKLVEFSDTQNTIGGLNITATRASVGSGATTAGLDATVTGGDDVRIFAGNATPASAPFRVTEAGVLTATNATVTGAITATSGTISGAMSITGSLTAGGGKVTLDSNGTSLSATSDLSSILKWVDPTNGTPSTASGVISTVRASNNTQTQIFTKSLQGFDASGVAVVQLGSVNTDLFDSEVNIKKYGSSHSTRASKGFISLGASDGIVIEQAFSDQLPATLLDVRGDAIRISTAKTPASASATCSQGTIAWDSNFVYVCVATNQWKRSAISTW